MADKQLLDSITVSISTVLLLLGMENYFKEYLYAYAIWMVVIGLIILVLGRKLIKDLEVSWAKRILTTSVGLMLLITGIDYFLEVHMAQYGLLYILVALVLFHYHGYLTSIFKR